jgi:endonuclease YncB( thermonuclease family)
MVRAIFLAVLLLVTSTAFASSHTAIPAYVESVYDGDTINVTIPFDWIGTHFKLGVRIEGIDTPEIRGKCEYEKQLAVEARDFLKKIVMPYGDSIPFKVWIINPKKGKYAGRIIAKVLTPEGLDVAKMLIARGHGRVYNGGTRKPWCVD